MAWGKQELKQEGARVEGRNQAQDKGQERILNTPRENKMQELRDLQTLVWKKYYSNGGAAGLSLTWLAADYSFGAQD